MTEIDDTEEKKDQAIKEIERISNMSKETEISCLSIYERDDVISLYDVANILIRERKKLEKIKDIYNKCMTYETNNWFSQNRPEVRLINFDYNLKRLNLEIKNYFGRTISITYYKDAKFSSNFNFLFNKLGDILPEFFEQLLQFEDFETQKSTNIKSVNSKFYIDIKNDGIKVRFQDIFELQLLSKSSSRKKYEFNTNKWINNNCEEYKYKLLQNIYVKIEDCPEWMQADLYNIRENILEKEKRANKKKNNQKRKFLSFKKKNS